MKVGISQPYIFPYIGYFQLIKAVDIFVFYDDVNYIKSGWINRNRILLNNTDHLFSIPIKSISQNRKINETKISEAEYNKWLNKFLISLKLSYKNAPYFENAFHLIETTLNKESLNCIADIAICSVETCANYLKLDTQFYRSSELNQTHINKRLAERLINIVKDFGADTYINSTGGKDIYTKDEFKQMGVSLYFLNPKLIKYKQFNNRFIPWLSIIDILMFNSKDEIIEMLESYNLE